MYKGKVVQTDKYKTFMEKLYEVKDFTRMPLTNLQKELKVDGRTTGVMVKMGLIEVQPGTGKSGGSLVKWKSSLDVDSKLVGQLTDALKDERRIDKKAAKVKTDIAQGRSVIELVPNKAKPIAGTLFTHEHLKAIGKKINLKENDVTSVNFDNVTEINCIDMLLFNIDKTGSLTIEGKTENGTTLVKILIGKKAIGMCNRFKTLLIETIS